MDSTETDVLFRNVQEMGEAGFESYKGKFIIIRNADYTMLVERAGVDDPLGVGMAGGPRETTRYVNVHMVRGPRRLIIY